MMYGEVSEQMGRWGWKILQKSGVFYSPQTLHPSSELGTLYKAKNSNNLLPGN
jgi:hypothetical protein